MLQRHLSRMATLLAAVALAVGLSSVQAKSSTGGNSLAGASSYSRASAPVSFASVTIDFSVDGIDSMDESGSPFNFVSFAFLGANAHVIGIGYDLNIVTVGDSWLSEAVIGFTDVGQTTARYLIAGIGNDFGGGGSYSSGGVVDLVSIGLDFYVGADGNLRVEFFETFDDNFQSADAHYIRGSKLFVEYEAPMIPEASTYAMMALGLAGIGVVVRRRHA